jgi:pimeloyl-ACP methyl ester carboxylesterase
VIGGNPTIARGNPALLESLRSFEDSRSGVREEFLTPTLGGGRTVAILSTPIGPTRPLGWVLCQSYGPEQDLLLGLEVPMVRALAAAGFPVLRYHSRGYGDSDVDAEQATVQTHVDDAIEAVGLLRGATGVASVGLAGAYFGGTVAALAADRLTGSAPVSAVAMWDPAVRGRDYVRTLLRLGLMTELIGTGRGEGAKDPTETLRVRGVVDVVGFPVLAAVYDEITSVDLAADLRSFRGASLAVQLSKSSRPRSDMVRLTDALTTLGGQVTFEVVARPDFHRLRRPRFHGLGDGTKVDTQEGLVTSLLDATLAWSLSLEEGG